MEKDIRFYPCDFQSTDWENPQSNNNWIENEQEAITVQLHVKNSETHLKSSDDFYRSNAQYLFAIGGGDKTVDPKECFAIAKNDTFFIHYKPTQLNSPVGEAAPSLICMQINKNAYPAHRNMKIVFVQE